MSAQYFFTFFTYFAIRSNFYSLFEIDFQKTFILPLFDKTVYFTKNHCGSASILFHLLFLNLHSEPILVQKVLRNGFRFLAYSLTFHINSSSDCVVENKNLVVNCINSHTVKRSIVMHKDKFIILSQFSTFFKIHYDFPDLLKYFFHLC